MAIELDYAYLAEFAKTDKGTLTAIGASFTEVHVESFPAILEIAVAGRVRKSIDEPSPTLRIDFHNPGGDPLVSVEGDLENEVDSVQYAGKTASVFAYRGPLLLPESGQYWCRLYLGEKLVRELAFTASS